MGIMFPFEMIGEMVCKMDNRGNTPPVLRDGNSCCIRVYLGKILEALCIRSPELVNGLAGIAHNENTSLCS